MALVCQNCQSLTQLLECAIIHGERGMHHYFSMGLIIKQWHRFDIDSKDVDDHFAFFIIANKIFNSPYLMCDDAGDTI